MSRLALLAVICAAALFADSTRAPAIQWVQTTGGSGTNQVTAAVADANGNLYITGSTSSLDFPVTGGAVQPSAGGSVLYRIDRVTGASEKLYPPGVSRLSNVVFDPLNPQVVYAASVNSVLRSLDGGTTWGSLFSFPAEATVYSIAVDPFDRNTLYAGMTTTGIQKSRDGGLTWAAMNIGISPQASGAIQAAVWTDPTTPNVVFASVAYRGLLRSGDGGASWTMVASEISGSVIFDPFSPGTIYFANAMQINKSTDDGNTFAVAGSLGNQVYVTALAADPFHAGVLYAASTNGILQSSDAGATWTVKSQAQATLLVADPKYPVLYANISSYGLARSSDGFVTSEPVGPPEMLVAPVAFGGQWMYVIAQPSTDAFVVKLDADGKVVYSTYFGGSAADAASAIAVANDGSVYATGSTWSADFPVTQGAFTTTKPGLYGSNFLFKLDAGGKLAWATYFADANTTVTSIAVDPAGNPIIGGYTSGGLQTTAGAYQTQFQRTEFCTGLIGCFPGPSAAFVTKFKADGSGLIYSTYVSSEPNNTQPIQNAQALIVDGDGNVYFGGKGTFTANGSNVVKLNATGSAVLGSIFENWVTIDALARDAAGNIYVTGSTINPGGTDSFQSTQGAFQTAPQPPAPTLPTQSGAGGGQDAFVLKLDAGLSKVLAATFLGGELVDAGESIAIDASGNVVVSGFTDSRAFPVLAPFQTAFAARSGFVTALDPSLSRLVYSTYLGDTRGFDATVAVPDAHGNVLIAGSVLSNPGTTFLAGDPGYSYTQGSIIAANKIALPAAPALRLDSVVSAATRLAAPLAPGEAVSALGSGFPSDAQLLFDGAPAATISRSATELVAVVPDGAKSSGPVEVTVSSGAAASNMVLMPAAPASPGLFSVAGNGVGQGYILNSDGTMNSPANPAAPGSAITIFATGAGPLSFSGGYAVTALTPSVYIDGFYANGISAVAGPVAGLPGTVYQLSIYVPEPAKLVSANPNLLNFKFPPKVPVQLVIGAVSSLNPINSNTVSQQGLAVSIAQ